MHIKCVTIQGFKSYRDKTVVGPFHSGHNVVVGRNGSGKSNFFSAIEFVLSNEFSSLRVEQRCSLLHEGSGARPINAMVEILFDNTDRRFPMECDEVSIKRSIGAKKDQFYVNNKLASNKSEVVGMLEAAGFSYSNPYYIVKQGQINTLACCSEKDRLRVVREVAGTEVYTEKRKGAEVELTSTDTVLAQVGDSLRLVADKLEQLGEEKETLEQFKVLDKKRRAVEFAIVEKDLKEAREKLEVMDAEVNDFEEETEESRRRFEIVSVDLEEGKRQLSKLMKQQKVLIFDKKAAEEEMERVVRLKEGLELKVGDADDQSQGEEMVQENLEQTKQLQKDVEDKLIKINNEIEVVMGKTEEGREKLALLEQERNQVYVRKGRREQFDTREERDAWINNEVEDIQKQLESKQLQILELSNILQSCREKWNEGEATKQANDDKRVDLEKQMEDARANMIKSLGAKTEVSRAVAELSKTTNLLKQSRDELEEEERNLKLKLKTIPGLKQVLAGHESILKVLETDKRLQEGYYGMVIHNFNCPDKMFTAVDETAGMKLFNHVVETDKVATELLAKLNRMKLPGVFNFMPLNRIRARRFDYSGINSKDAFPIKEKISYDEELEEVISFVFGKTLVCRNMDTVIRLARSSNMDCITLDGEKGSSKGVLSGGYVSIERSKMGNYARYQMAGEKLVEVTKKIELAEGDLSRMESELAMETKNGEKYQNQLAWSESSLSKLMVECQVIEGEEEDLKRKCLEEEQRLGTMRTDQKLMQAALSSLHLEKEEDLNSQLSSQEKSKCDMTVKEIEKVRSKYKMDCKAKDKLESEKLVAESESLRVKKEVAELISKLADLRKMETSVRTARQELEVVKVMVEKERDGLENVCAKEEKLTTALVGLKEKVDMKEKSLMDLKQFLGEDNMRKEKMLEKKLHLQTLVKKLNTKMNSLGGVQSDMVDRYKLSKRTLLMKELQKIDKKLKQFDNVNKKALDQYVTFTEENERLMGRHNQLVEDKTRIIGMMNVLDNQKSEQILYTYKQLYKNFEQVFKSIVPAGNGKLILTGVAEGDNEADMMENATGLTTSVSFTGNQEMKNMDQLSGGQKTVVALAFILAIQQCDPAPFYLFDEVDAALDVDHRRAIAAVIHSQSDGAQFITTTFRPEMLLKADRCFGVTFRGKASHVDTVEREEARSFVQDAAIQN